MQADGATIRVEKADGRTLVIPRGTCHCGCGQPTPLSTATRTELGWVRGEPRDFVPHHNKRPTAAPILVDPFTGCWEWQWMRDEAGYGRVARVAGSQTMAHCMVYEKFNGPIADDLQLDHLCRNRGCVNPRHLEPVTNVENVRRGSAAKLTIEIARDIRASSDSIPTLMRRFDVSRATISNVRAGRTWREE